jgi:hypothetical protein
VTFLNSAVLAALTLGLLPVLIHLLNRQRFKKVDFPTLRFLRELQRQKMRQIRLRQILLLALRTLAVLFLVFALARPVLKSTAGILPGAKARTTAVLILDRSASMHTETTDGIRFRNVQTRAQEILASLKDADDAQIIWADDNPDVFPSAPTSQTNLLREAVMNTQPTESGSDLVQSLQRARAILGASQNMHKEVYVLSDCSVSAWPDKMPEAELLPKDVRVFLLPTETKANRNLGITDAAVTSRIMTPGRPVDVGFTLRNTGTSAANDRIVSIYVGGRRVAQTRASLAPGETKIQHLKFVPDAPGDQVGYVRLEESDDFASDDQRFFVLRVPSRLQVALVGEDGPARALTALALNPTGDPGAFVNVKTLSPAAFESEDWSPFDAIVIADASSFNSNISARLHSYVEDGKGVLVMFGPQTDLRNSSVWLAQLGLPSPSETWHNDSAPARWSNPDLQHPLFEGLFEEKPSSITPELTTIVKTSGSSTAVEVIGTTAGVPFLLESKVGRGRALLMCSAADPAWSSLYRNGIFPPLMVSSVAYLSGVGTSGTEFQFFCGQPAMMRFAGVPTDAKFELRGEQTLLPNVESTPAGYQLTVSGLHMPGAYDLWQGNRRLAAVAVNVPARESEIQAAPEASYRTILGGQVMLLGERASVQAAILEGRFGRELWKLCLFLALACLLAEMLIGRVGKKDAATI